MGPEGGTVSQISLLLPGGLEETMCVSLWRCCIEFSGLRRLVPLTGEVCRPFVSAGPNLAAIYLMKYWIIVCRRHTDLFWKDGGAQIAWIFMGGTKYAILGIPATSGVINGCHYSRCCVPISSLVIYSKIFKMGIYFHSSRYYVGHHICMTPVLALFPIHLFIGFSFPIIFLRLIYSMAI